MRVALIGPPGAGKSTQARLLSWTLPFYNRSPRVSTGDMVRAEIEAGTDLGIEMKEYYGMGEPVPDEMILPLVFRRLRPSGGFVLDDFPANVAQARALDEEIEERGAGGISRVVALEGLSGEDLLRRIMDGRVVSRVTGEVYHLRHDPPPERGERLDPGPFVRREDDTEEAVRRGLLAYDRESDALKQHYEEKGVLSIVDTRGPIDEVAEEILGLLGHPEEARHYAG